MDRSAAKPWRWFRKLQNRSIPKPEHGSTTSSPRRSGQKKRGIRSSQATPPASMRTSRARKTINYWRRNSPTARPTMRGGRPRQQAALKAEELRRQLEETRHAPDRRGQAEALRAGQEGTGRGQEAGGACTAAGRSRAAAGRGSQTSGDGGGPASGRTGQPRREGRCREGRDADAGPGDPAGAAASRHNSVRPTSRDCCRPI